jgi:cyclase
MHNENHTEHHHIRQYFHASRRQVLMGLGATALAAAVRMRLADLIKPVPEALALEKSPPLFRIQRVSEGVYAAIARPAAMINCNAAVILTSDNVIVVDSHSKPSAARALINQIRTEITDRPVRYVINSHFHWDHAQGNAAYPETFGKGVDIVSTTATREWLKREGEARLRQSLDSLPKQISDARKQLSSAKTAAERERLTTRIAELEAYLKEMTPPRITLPTITFDQQLIIHQGGREIHLLFLGRGHTAGDVVVHIPSERVVATGDLMHSILPYIGDGYPDEWPRTLTALEKLDFNKVVPGHGSVQEGKAVLASFRAYLEEISEAVARAIERGVSLEELQRSLSPDRLRSLSAGGNGARIERELASVMGASRPQLGEGVAANIADVYNYYTKRRKG